MLNDAPSSARGASVTTRQAAGVVAAVARVEYVWAGCPDELFSVSTFIVADLTPEDRAYCAAWLPRLDRYAGRVAALTAVERAAAEAFGHRPERIGLRPGAGAPSVELWCAHHVHVGEVRLSIAHEGGTAIALAVAELVRAAELV